MDVGEEEERPRGEGGEGGSGAEANGAEESGVGVGGEGEQMDEDEEKEGMGEDETAAEETPETGGEKEREEIGSSADSAARGTDERKEARRRELKEGRRTGKRILKWAKLKMSYILCDVGDVSEYGGGNSAVRLVAF
ncbi:unnamed protein product [Arctogadus glacialis]